MSSTQGLPYALTAVASYSRNITPDAPMRPVPRLGAPQSAIASLGVPTSLSVDVLRADVRERMEINPNPAPNTGYQGTNRLANEEAEKTEELDSVMLEYFLGQTAKAREQKLLEIKGKYLTEEQKQELAKQQLAELSTMDGRLVRIADEIAGLKMDADEEEAAAAAGAYSSPARYASRGAYEPELVAVENILGDKRVPPRLEAELTVGELIEKDRRIPPRLGAELTVGELIEKEPQRPPAFGKGDVADVERLLGELTKAENKKERDAIFERNKDDIKSWYERLGSRNLSQSQLRLKNHGNIPEKLALLMSAMIRGTKPKRGGEALFKEPLGRARGGAARK